MIQAMQGQKFSEFRQKYVEKTDVLIIDDIHELKNRTGTQDQFFHIFNGSSLYKFIVKSLGWGLEFITNGKNNLLVLLNH